MFHEYLHPSTSKSRLFSAGRTSYSLPTTRVTRVGSVLVGIGRRYIKGGQLWKYGVLGCKLYLCRDDNSKLRYEQGMAIVQEHVSVMHRLLRTIFEGTKCPTYRGRPNRGICAAAVAYTRARRGCRTCR